jgi:hypothetical protein
LGGPAKRNTEAEHVLDLLSWGGRQTLARTSRNQGRARRDEHRHRVVNAPPAASWGLLLAQSPEPVPPRLLAHL